MYICFLLPMDTLSGGSFVVCEHAWRLQEKGHKVVVAFRSPPENCGPFASQAYNVPTMDWGCARAERFDVVIATWWETVLHIFELKSKSYAYFVQSDERRFYPRTSPLAQNLVELTYRWPIPTVTIATWLQEMFRDEFGKYVALARNGVSADVFSPAPPIDPPKSKPLRVLIEGPGGVEFKRVAFAFEVTRQVANIEVWYISSDGVVEESWQADKIFHPQPRHEMRHIYSSCDVLLKLSTVEGFFGPPLEMMACGGTAVVSAVTGHDEYIVDGENALVVPLDDRGAAAQALEQLRDNPQLLAKLKSGGIKTASAMNWERSSDCMEKFLNDVVHQGESSKPAHADYLAAYGRALWAIHLATPNFVSAQDFAHLDQLLQTARELATEAGRLDSQLGDLFQLAENQKLKLESLESPIA